MDEDAGRWEEFGDMKKLARIGNEIIKPNKDVGSLGSYLLGGYLHGLMC